MTYVDLSPLANHLWQSTVFAAIAWALTLALKHNRASVRYCLWLAASVKFLIPFSLLVSTGSRFGYRTTAVIDPPQWSFIAEHFSRPFTDSAPVSQIIAAPVLNPLPAILLGVWLCGATVGVGFWLRDWRLMRACRSAASPMKFDLPVPVLSSSTRLEPGIFGIRAPVLLLPKGITDHLTPPQLAAIVAHEMCHVRRRDNLTAAIHMIVEVLFWFYPLIWWIRARLIEERERACDEGVLQSGGDGSIYAEGILNVCKFYVESPPMCVSGVTGSDLKTRIEFIISKRAIRNLNPCKRVLLLIVGSLTLAGPIATGVWHPSPILAQSQAVSPLPTFDVASIKPSKAAEGSSTWNSSPAGSLRMQNQTLRDLIRIAYGVRDDQISAGPKWLDADRYNIDAKAAAPAKDSRLLLMLQALLVDRFKLSYHEETKPLRGFALVIGKKGLNINAVQPSQNNQLNTKGGHMVAKAVSLTKLAQMLSNLVGYPVTDETHVSDVFDFTLDWTPDPRRGSDDGQTTTVSDPSAGVPLDSALEDQLGLKLEVRKIPTKVLVIDHADKPSEN
jgi:bla regulator protein BlaR1